MLLIKTYQRLCNLQKKEVHWTYSSTWLGRPHNHGRRQGGVSHMLHGWQQAKREFMERNSHLKTVRSHETHSLSQEQHRKDPPPWFNHLSLGPSHNTWELWELQFKMRFGWGHSQTISWIYNALFLIWDLGGHVQHPNPSYRSEALISSNARKGGTLT